MSEITLDIDSAFFRSQPKLNPVIYDGGCKICVSFFSLLVLHFGTSLECRTGKMTSPMWPKEHPVESIQNAGSKTTATVSTDTLSCAFGIRNFGCFWG